MKRCVFWLVMLLVLGASSVQAAKEMVLWPNDAPGDKDLGVAEQYEKGHVQRVQTPTLTVFLPPKERTTGAAVVICPGGAYWLLAIDHEGYDIARWFNSIGVAGIVLKYRCRDFQHPIPMLDAQRAMRTVRYHAKDWGIDPRRIGIMGFSAGGHLASTVTTHFDQGKADAEDPIARISCRPDFAILMYPVITFTKETMHRGSRNNLLGKEPDGELVKLLSNELQVSPQTPPVFLVHSTDDRGVPVQNSIDFYVACVKAGVPAEMHVYEKGGHGFGMRADSCVAARDWPGRCEQWLGQRGFLGQAKGQ